MKLQEQISRKVGSKQYVKYVLTISSTHIEELGWHKGEELELHPKGNKAIIKPKK